MQTKNSIVFFWILTTSLFIDPAICDQISYIQMKETKLRSQPKIWALSIASLSYGDAVTVLSEQDGWSSVKTMKSKKGFIPSASMTSKKILFSNNQYEIGSMVDPTEAVLAGKGFDKETEESYAAISNGDFRTVDEIEKIKISDKELSEFITKGKLGENK